jgi:hypothetical protein
MIPDYVNCKNEEIVVCEFYMTKACPETCAYVADIKGREQGVGAVCDGGLIKRLSENDKP